MKAENSMLHEKMKFVRILRTQFKVQIKSFITLFIFGEKKYYIVIYKSIDI